MKLVIRESLLLCRASFPRSWGEGWDGGVVAGIAPIPTFPRCREKEQTGEYKVKSH